MKMFFRKLIWALVSVLAFPFWLIAFGFTACYTFYEENYKWKLNHKGGNK